MPSLVPGTQQVLNQCWCSVEQYLQRADITMHLKTLKRIFCLYKIICSICLLYRKTLTSSISLCKT